MSIFNMVYGKKQNGWKPGPNTILYLPLSEDFEDRSGKGQTISSSDGTSSISSYSGVPAAYFNMGRKRYTLSNIPANNFTVSAWTACERTSTWEILTFFSSNGNTGFYNFGISSSGYYWASGSNTGGDWNSSVGYQTGWHLMTLTFSSSTISMYLDGTLIASKIPSGTPSSDTFTICDLGGRSDVYSFQGWKGYISEYIMENKVRTAQEISDYYNQTKSNYGL